MACIPQSTWVFSLNSIHVSSSSQTPIFSPICPKTRPFKTLKISASFSESKSDSSPPNEDPSISDPVKLSFAKAKAYTKSKRSDQSPTRNPVVESSQIENKNETSRVSDPVKLAMKKAREYMKNKGTIGSEQNGVSQKKCSEIEKMKVENLRNGDVEKRVKKKEQSTISGIDFVGLDFSDKKKSRGLPPGLVPVSDPFPEGDLPEVEFIVGDTSKFEGAMSSRPSIKLGEEDDGSGLYKPKVSTWGVFPRPSNISEAFGGGRTISPGEVLETAEDKAAREARTRQLVAAYKNKMGLTIDAKTKSDCEKALKDGDYLMDLGNLRDALPYYEKVMKELVFQSELHGLAALQWSICQDSLSRPNEARGMYERLQSHPNVQVSKRARQFVFSFQVLSMHSLKVMESATLFAAGHGNDEGYKLIFLSENNRLPGLFSSICKR
ncbi:cytochrome C oxidase subunit isoform X2 [Tasmannia lanceolata]|uniref:cytochrome C oxidase subunit isoform X2 n=1 Tax=Tasmannia lanceolata TaxID=3420 RepID=UPI004063369D